MTESVATPRTIAYVGAYAEDDRQGGIHVIAVGQDGAELRPLQHVPEPGQAGYLAVDMSSRTLYAVDERKTDGRGPVGPPACVFSFTTEDDGRLTPLNRVSALGAFPTYLSIGGQARSLFTASHGSYDHVEHIVRGADGVWRSEFAYDDSTLVCYALEIDGSIGEVTDVYVFDGHGEDPNHSPQVGGHGQASPHAHCAVLDDSQRFLLVADKATDRIYTFDVTAGLHPVQIYQSQKETGPRHLAFHPTRPLVFATYEFSSEVVVFDYDVATGALTCRSRVSTLGTDPGRVNEPADIHVHPEGRTIYVNNRGEDTLAWFDVSEGGELHRVDAVPLAPSVHPGVAARSFAIDRAGRYLLVTDRPAGVVRAFAIDSDGGLQALTEVDAPGAAYVLLVESPPRSTRADLG